MSEGKTLKTAERVRCPGCGAELIFNTEEANLKCQYCGNKIEIKSDNTEIEEKDLFSNLAEEKWDEDTVSISCSACGAGLILDKNTSADICPFCGAKTIVESIKDALVPDAVIAFKISLTEAAKRFKSWLSLKFFAPRNLEKEIQMQKLKGIYLPVFTFDCGTSSDYSAQAGTYYYVTETRTVYENGKSVQKSEQVRKTSWRYVSGTYCDEFDDFKVSASVNTDKYFDKMIYNLSEAVPFKKEYLLGFFAEKNSVSLKDSWDNSKDKMNEDLTGRIENYINADEVRGLEFTTTFSNIKFKQILVPIWLSTYTYKNETFRFIVNGQTGVVEGKAPVSALKVLFIILLLLGAISFFIFLTQLK